VAGALGVKYRFVMVETHPIQYKAPLFRRLAEHPQIDLTVVYAMIPDARQQGAGFDVPFAWDVPLLGGYRHVVLDNCAKSPSVTRFSGCDTPGIFERLRHDEPDAVLVNGWVTKTCLQALWACCRLGIPCLVRGEANLLRPRVVWKHAVHRILLKQYSAYLAIGSAPGRNQSRFWYSARGLRISICRQAGDQEASDGSAGGLVAHVGGST
jgi:hypothetical protein